ncbi:MAG: hypothetical protein LAO23_19735 [Acidobacteriia bacterium]|nr:hypothetical protein [Terriglobia bacterium]
MRIVAIVLALALGACSTVKNPASVAGVYDVDASIGAVAAVVNQYRDLCVRKVALVYPKCREVVPILQNQLRIARGQVQQAVNYIRANPGDTVGLGPLVSQAQASLTQLQTDIRANGVPGAM